MGNFIKKNQKIYNKIIASRKEMILENKLSLIERIIFFENSKVKIILKELTNCSKEEQIYWLYFLIDIKNSLKIDYSTILLGLYNKLYNNFGKEFNINDNDITFINDENTYKAIEIFSNINFTNLNIIIFQNCKINNKYLNILGNIFTNNLISLDLSNNQISDITLFKYKEFSRLINLDLSNNQISDISPLFNCIMQNLKNLNLKNNIISDIKNIETASFESIEYLELSHNKIMDINYLEKVKIKNIREINLSYNDIKDSNIFSILVFTKINKLDLSNNRIEKMDISKLFINCGYVCRNLIIEIKIDNVNENKYNILFVFSDKIIIKLDYLIEIEKLNEFFQNLSFKNIKYLTIEGIKQLDFLQNESLKELKSLNLEKSNIEDLSIFDNIHFFNIYSIQLGINKIKKGFHSLNVFKSIKTKDVLIKFESNTYVCYLNIDNPKINLNIIFENLEFLKDDIINGIEKLSISNCIFSSNLDFFNCPTFKSLKELELNNNYIDNIELFSILGSFLQNNNKIKTNFIDNKCNPNLIKHLNENLFIEMESITNSKEPNMINVKYISPFKFNVIIDYNNLNDIPYFKSCKKIDIQNTDLKNINFLGNETLTSLRSIILNHNKIENIDILNKILSNQNLCIKIKIIKYSKDY